MTEHSMIGVVIRANAERLAGVTLGERDASDLNAVANVQDADEMRVSVELCAHAGRTVAHQTGRKHVDTCQQNQFVCDCSYS